ncbi:hypothetical protein E2C01_032612 [Portunus trituberculatus]|uniref:Uncharacterized protein n=1 Tax=Portunus trituberculatus TaxID=210409 RepID=A0A5B7EXZ4_PORTR|nr:hypothetical protein [Portunus trituberculatus]
MRKIRATCYVARRSNGKTPGWLVLQSLHHAARRRWRAIKILRLPLRYSQFLIKERRGIGTRVNVVLYLRLWINKTKGRKMGLHRLTGFTPI